MNTQNKYPLRAAMLAGTMHTISDPGEPVGSVGNLHAVPPKYEIHIKFETLEQMQDARKALYHAILEKPENSETRFKEEIEPGRFVDVDPMDVMKAIRTDTIEECAKVADSCKLRAEQTYGAAESVGADMAARSIRRLADLAAA